MTEEEKLPEKDSDNSDEEKEVVEEDNVIEDKEEENEESSEDDEILGLEESIENFQGNLDFSQLSWPSAETEASAPVLEKIAGEQPRPMFVGTIPRGSSTGISSGNGEKKDEMKYLPDFDNNDEPKYIATPEKVNTRPERVDFSKAGREQINPAGTMREAPSPESYKPNVDSSTQERAWQPERFDTEKAGRESPVEREEVKYKSYKPKLPDKNY